jgi:hypothetical protein
MLEAVLLVLFVRYGWQRRRNWIISIVCLLALAYFSHLLTHLETVVRIGFTSTLELSSGIVASCLATMRPLLRHVRLLLTPNDSTSSSFTRSTKTNSDFRNENNDGKVMMSLNEKTSYETNLSDKSSAQDNVRNGSDEFPFSEAEASSEKSSKRTLSLGNEVA